MIASHPRLPVASVGLLLLLLLLGLLGPLTPPASAQPPATAHSASPAAPPTEEAQWLLRGIASLREGRQEAARTAFAEFLARAPEPEAWRTVANAYLAEGQLPDAIAALQGMVRTGGGRELELILRSLVFVLEGSATQAVSGLTEAVHTSPNAGLWNLLGQQLEHLGRMRDAVQAYGQATVLQPEESRYWRSLGEAYERMGQYPRALASHREVVARHPSVDAWSAVGRVELAQKDYPEAAKAYDEAVKLAPRDLDALAGLGMAYGAQKEWAAALDTYHKVKAIDPVAAEELFGIVFAGRKT